MSNNPLTPGRATILPEQNRNAPTVVNIEEVLDVGMISLRGSGKKAFADKIKMATGLTLPKVRKFTHDQDKRLLWMSPDEWLLICPYSDVADYCTALEDELGSQHSAITDVSDARVVLQIRGDGAREVLMKGSPIVLHTDQFKPGDVRRTQFNEISAAHIMIADKPPEFHLIAFRSYAQHIHDYLVAGAHPDAMVNLL